MPVSNEGLKLLERLLTPINHGCDVKEQLQFREVLEELRGLMKDREFVAGLI
jgi:Zn-dependent M16 (insulinase) family peptidase